MLGLRHLSICLIVLIDELNTAPPPVPPRTAGFLLSQRLVRPVYGTSTLENQKLLILDRITTERTLELVLSRCVGETVGDIKVQD
ncbi:hypothetical protein F4803DRAFT_496279 [Xylaria telfairii]|nr:hypothetical protein F4803DRAFT_496279 [Xylaria telfairii]